MLSVNKVSLSFGGPPLLNEVCLEIQPGDRLALIGRNGTGKTSFFRLIEQSQKPDSGDVTLRSGFTVASLPQDVPDGISGSIIQIIGQPLQGKGLSDWEIETAIEQTLKRMQLTTDLPFEQLSTGQKRRILLAQAVVNNPDILLLDEPTNHLDLQSIAWLESFLNSFSGAILLVTHDRAFLQSVAKSILDLDRGSLTRWDCDYATYLTRKEEWLEAEMHQQAVFDKKLAEEEVWIRKGIQARRTRNEGRVRALKKMREEHRERRETTGTVRMAISQADRSGVKVIAAENVTYAYQDDNIISDFSTLIERGDRIGLVGPNGAGKSTLLKLLLGKFQPNSGTIEHGTNLKIAYFDQTREQLDDDATVHDCIADGNAYVEVDGQRQHVLGYLRDFLFPPDRAKSRVRYLSGGERNRLLLARLFTRPFNLLILDEPTNDLDLETLELLEERLCDYQGTLLLVSHDRAFLNNVVTDIYALEGNGRIESYVGGYDDYLRERERRSAFAIKTKASADKGKKPQKTRKFLNREQWELDALPTEIETLDQENAQIAETLADPNTYIETPDRIPQLQQRNVQIEELLIAKFARWEELEALKKSLDRNN